MYKIAFTYFMDIIYDALNTVSVTNNKQSITADNKLQQPPNNRLAKTTYSII